jgi:hypothetical protein
MEITKNPHYLHGADVSVMQRFQQLIVSLQYALVGPQMFPHPNPLHKRVSMLRLHYNYSPLHIPFPNYHMSFAIKLFDGVALPCLCG